MTLKTSLSWAAVPLLALTLAACGGDGPGGAEAAPEPSSRTLAASLMADGDLDTLEQVLANSGLESVLQGVGPYTVFAPTDAAFTAAGDTASSLTEADLKAQSVAMLRAHIVPGALTRADIEAAIDGGGKAEVRTMADTLLTLTRDGDAIVVTAPDGATGRLADEEELASNGVLQPVDAVLVKPAG